MYVCLLRTGALHPLCIFHGVLSGLVSPYSNNTHTYIAWRHGHIHTRWVGYARWEKTQEKSHMNETAISISPSFFYHIFPWYCIMRGPFPNIMFGRHSSISFLEDHLFLVVIHGRTGQFSIGCLQHFLLVFC